MHRQVRHIALASLAGIVCVWAALRIISHDSALPTDEILKAFHQGGPYRPLTIRYPLDGTLFPPEIVPPAFAWEDDSQSDAWVVAISFPENEGERGAGSGGSGVPDAASATGLSFECPTAQWTPSDEQWETIKRHSVRQPATVTILGVNRQSPVQIVSAATVRISTSEDPVAAPIFYREVGLPFLTAVRDTATHIRWRFGEISSKQQPPVVLDRLPVCANCHSFSADGKVLGMDVDYANDKGSYVLDGVAKEIVLKPDKIITWSDYRREDGESTFGLLSQVSPDGRYVAGTVKDQSVFVARDDLTFSQLFFPIKGILAIYDRTRKEFRALPGADDPAWVQSNPSWSPDGKTIVFARSKVYRPSRRLRRNVVLLRAEDCAEFLDGRQGFQFDLYRIPFNDGRGGKAEPLAGASHNGMSNYFARYSPDGKWIVFCKARNFMLLQPDSELWIVPSEGGRARRMECNTPRMNSWHSWSPNGRWLVFSSKWNTPYTQLFLTHVGQDGRSTPPVLLSQFTAADRAANIPEFVRAEAGAIEKIREQFIDDTYYARSGDLLRFQGDHELALRDFEKAIELNPNNVQAHVGMGASLAALGKIDKAKTHLLRAIEMEPQSQHAHDGLGDLLAQQGKVREAAASFREALRIDPTLGLTHCRLGLALVDLGELDEAQQHLSEAIRLEPMDARANCSLGVVFSRKGKLEQAAVHYRRALAIQSNLVVALGDLASILATSSDPALRSGGEAVSLATRACELTSYRNPTALLALSEAFAEAGRLPDAIFTAEQTLQLAASPGNQSLIDSAKRHIERYRQGAAWRRGQ